VHTAVEKRDRGSANKEGEMPQLAPRVREGKITDCHFHELRHPCATRMVQGGVDLYKVPRLLEPTSPIMTQRYREAGQPSTQANHRPHKHGYFDSCFF
jgi:site-specific recombinase XerD